MLGSEHAKDVAADHAHRPQAVVAPRLALDLVTAAYPFVPVQRKGIAQYAPAGHRTRVHVLLAGRQAQFGRPFVLEPDPANGQEFPVLCDHGEVDRLADKGAPWYDLPAVGHVVQDVAIPRAGDERDDQQDHAKGGQSILLGCQADRHREHGQREPCLVEHHALAPRLGVLGQDVCLFVRRIAALDLCAHASTPSCMTRREPEPCPAGPGMDLCTGTRGSPRARVPGRPLRSLPLRWIVLAGVSES